MENKANLEVVVGQFAKITNSSCTCIVCGNKRCTSDVKQCTNDVKQCTNDAKPTDYSITTFQDCEHIIHKSCLVNLINKTNKSEFIDIFALNKHLLFECKSRSMSTMRFSKGENTNVISCPCNNDVKYTLLSHITTRFGIPKQICATVVFFGVGDGDDNSDTSPYYYYMATPVDSLHFMNYPTQKYIFKKYNSFNEYGMFKNDKFNEQLENNKIINTIYESCMEGKNEEFHLIKTQLATKTEMEIQTKQSCEVCKCTNPNKSHASIQDYWSFVCNYK